MQIRRRVELWVLGAALLASGEFSYAHLRQVGIWPWEVVGSSLWRVMAAYLGASGFRGPVGIAAAGFLACAGLAAAVALRIRLSRAHREEVSGNE